MRDTPWHIEIPTAEQHQCYKNGITGYELAAELKKLAAFDWDHWKPLGRFMEKQEPHSSPEELSWFFEEIPKKTLDQWLTDRSAKEFLATLEQVVWIVQAGSLKKMRQEDPDFILGKKFSTAMQTAFSLGEACAKNRWRTEKQRASVDLKTLYFTLHETPFSGYPDGRGFFVRRALSQALEVEFKLCPHHQPMTYVQDVADELCRVHNQWLKGYLMALEPSLQIHSERSSQGCIQSWSLTH